MLKLNEDVVSHFLLLLSAQITVSQSVPCTPATPAPPHLPSIFQLCPIPFLPLPSINSAVHEWLLYDSAISHQAQLLKCQEDIILTVRLPQQTNTHHFSVFRPRIFHQATISSTVVE